MAAEPYPTTEVQLNIPLRFTLSAKSGTKHAHRAVQTYRVLRELLNLRPGGLTQALGAWSLSMDTPPEGSERSYKRARAWKAHELLFIRTVRTTDEAPRWRLMAAILNAYFHDGEAVRTGSAVKHKANGGVTAAED